MSEAARPRRASRRAAQQPQLSEEELDAILGPEDSPPAKSKRAVSDEESTQDEASPSRSQRDESEAGVAAEEEDDEEEEEEQQQRQQKPDESNDQEDQERSPPRRGRRPSSDKPTVAKKPKACGRKRSASASGEAGGAGETVMKRPSKKRKSSEPEEKGAVVEDAEATGDEEAREEDQDDQQAAAAHKPGAGAQGVLFRALTSGAALKSVVNGWLQRYRKDGAASVVELATFVAQCAGATGRLAADVDHSDAVALLSESTTLAAGQYPLVAKDKALRSFRTRFVDFWAKLVSAVKGSVLFDGVLMAELTEWLRAIGASGLRSFRHTASEAAFAVTAGLIDAVLEERSQREALAQHADVKGAARRPKGLDAELRAVEDRVKAADKMLKDLFESVFAHRWRDTAAVVRETCMQHLGKWICAYPAVFLDDTYLKYLGWCMNDRDDAVRRACLESLLAVYKSPAHVRSLEFFTSRFKKRIFEMAYDRDSRVAAAAVDLTTQLVRRGLISESDADNVPSLIWDKDPAVARAAARFVYEDCFAEEEEKRRDVTPTERHNLNVQDLNEVLKLHFLFCPVPPSGEREDIDVEASTSALVDAFWDILPCLQDWQAMGGLLKFALSARPKSKRAAPAAGKPKKTGAQGKAGRKKGAADAEEADEQGEDGEAQVEAGGGDGGEADEEQQQQQQQQAKKKGGKKQRAVAEEAKAEVPVFTVESGEPLDANSQIVLCHILRAAAKKAVAPPPRYFGRVSQQIKEKSEQALLSLVDYAVPNLAELLRGFATDSPQLRALLEVPRVLPATSFSEARHQAIRADLFRVLKHIMQVSFEDAIVSAAAASLHHFAVEATAGAAASEARAAAREVASEAAQTVARLLGGGGALTDLSEADSAACKGALQRLAALARFMRLPEGAWSDIEEAQLDAQVLLASQGGDLDVPVARLLLTHAFFDLMWTAQAALAEAGGAARSKAVAEQLTALLGRLERLLAARNADLALRELAFEVLTDTLSVFNPANAAVTRHGVKPAESLIEAMCAFVDATLSAASALGSELETQLRVARGAARVLLLWWPTMLPLAAPLVSPLATLPAEVEAVVKAALAKLRERNVDFALAAQLTALKFLFSSVEGRDERDEAVPRLAARLCSTFPVAARRPFVSLLRQGVEFAASGDTAANLAFLPLALAPYAARLSPSEAATVSEALETAVAELARRLPPREREGADWQHIGAFRDVLAKKKAGLPATPRRAPRGKSAASPARSTPGSASKRRRVQASPGSTASAAAFANDPLRDESDYGAGDATSAAAEGDLFEESAFSSDVGAERTKAAPRKKRSPAAKPSRRRPAHRSRFS